MNAQASLKDGRSFTVSNLLVVDEAKLMAAPDAEQETVQPCGHDNRRLRVLLADDNIDFVESIAVLLRGAGHTVRVCHDGAQALAAADAFAPEYAFLDIGLPRINGYDLARALRKLPSLEHTVLVAVTGWGQQKDRLMAQEAGFTAHLVKPVAVDQILAILAGSREGMLQPPQ